MTSMIKRIDHWFVKANEFVICVLFFAMFVLVFTNVVTRYVFSFSLNWAEELSRYMMIAMAYLGAGLAMREGQHVAIESLQERLPKPIRRWLRAFVSVIHLAFMGFLTYLGYQYAAFAMDQETAALQWPVGLFYMAMPIGALAFALHVLAIFRTDMDKELGFSEEVPKQPGSIGGVGA